MQVFLGIALLIAAVAALVFALRWQAAAKRADETDRRVRQLNSTVEKLSKYRGVADADEHAAKLIREAEAQAAALRAKADRDLEAAAAAAAQAVATAKTEAEALVADAKERARSMGQQADASVAAAQARADQIVQDANVKAEAIAGDALAAMRNAEQWERTVRALKNVVEGYGDEYIVPTPDLLDDLAEGFGHTEAGQQLKLIRTQIREAVKDGRAGTCEYVEDNRRTTAIRFVVDAFNGKADSILTRVKQDNAAKLQQELRDAFALVNHNGQAFRDARIVESYLSLRLEELRWACVLEALRLEEREEQRRIRERIREEEKARREFERAIREAAKEEDALRRAMGKAQAQLAKATDEQRERYEAQLHELTKRLEEAEAKNQRALSMAQQTRRGHVYIISNVGSLGENVYKIGLTRRLDPLDRVRELGDSSVPFDFDVHAMIFSEDSPALESRLHRHFVMAQVNKVNHRKEFFRADLAHIRAEVEALGLAAQWTMAAEARQYRETRAIEERIANDPKAAEAWARRQLTLEEAEPLFASDEELPTSSAEEGAA